MVDISTFSPILWTYSVLALYTRESRNLVKFHVLNIFILININRTLGNMSVDQGGENIRSVLSLITHASGADKNAKDRLLYRTLGGPKNLPEVVEKVEMIEAVKDTLPESMQDVALEAKEILIKSLIATTSIKGAFLTMLTTQKSEFKVTDPRMRRQIAGGILRGGDEGGF